MEFSRQNYCSGLPFPSPMDRVLSELSTMTHPSWVVLHDMAHSFIELGKSVIHVISLVVFCGLHSVCPLMDKDKGLMEATWWERPGLALVGVHDMIQEVVIKKKNTPKKKKCKKARWLSEEALPITEKRREAKGNGEKERYKHPNSEFQRIARRDKKALLSDQCKEIEENNRMGKTRDLFKKIRDTKEIFHAKIVTIKDRHTFC